jgi:hypothetical protein
MLLNKPDPIPLKIDTRGRTPVKVGGPNVDRAADVAPDRYTSGAGRDRPWPVRDGAGPVDRVPRLGLSIDVTSLVLESHQELPPLVGGHERSGHRHGVEPLDHRIECGSEVPLGSRLRLNPRRDLGLLDAVFPALELFGEQVAAHPSGDTSKRHHGGKEFATLHRLYHRPEHGRRQPRVDRSHPGGPGL